MRLLQLGMRWSLLQSGRSSQFADFKWIPFDSRPHLPSDLIKTLPGYPTEVRSFRAASEASCKDDIRATLPPAHHRDVTSGSMKLPPTGQQYADSACAKRGFCIFVAVRKERFVNMCPSQASLHMAG